MGRLWCVHLPRMLASSMSVLFCFFLHCVHVVTSAAANNADVLSPSLLHLNVGLNLSVDTLFSARGYIYDHATTTYRESGAFWPILSSPGFNSSNSSKSLGFSVGFYFPSSLDGQASKNYIYLAVCGGLSGNYSRSFGMDLGVDAIIELARDGYVVPVWIANLHSPLTSLSSSLVVVAVSNVGAATSSNELQLRDDNGTVVWRVSNVGMMEMKDTGNLVIYDTVSRTNVVWQSSTLPRETLLQGQNLTVGKELRSNDSSYLVRMEKGGLVFYLNNIHFIEQPSPYWVIPIISPNMSLNVTNFLDLNTLVSSSPCGPADTAYSMVDHSVRAFIVEPGSCSDSSIFISPSEDTSDSSPSGFNLWRFVKLETDGWLYSYIVYFDASGVPSTERYALSTTDIFDDVGWRECAVPMSCGPLGVCSPGATSLCACPLSSPEGLNFFDPVETTDFSKGCKRSTSLPHCSSGNEHINTTDFLQLNHTASIFLFGGWAFNSTSALVDECKNSCSFNCSCNGFFYQANDSACYFITDEISLLNVTDQNISLRDWSRRPGALSHTSSVTVALEIFARNYVTYLKVASAANNSTGSSSNHSIGSSSGPASSVSHTGNVVAIAVVSSCVACLVLGLAVYLVSARKRRMNKQARQAKEEEELRDILPLLPSRFSYQDLHQATEAFSNLLGSGGCGSVYAGVLPDGRKIAVKILESMLKGQSKQFLAEVATIGRTSHHNVVRLVGFCWEVSHRMLVYEHVERGSLDRWLFVKDEAESAAGGASAPLLNWQTRYDVALGIARGLCYLHEECPQPILHFDVKPQNILLDGAFVAKLSDFGMSRLMQRDVSEVVTGVRGTPGYIAPEWLSHGVVSKKSDVYSMGMVMLEIVGGRRNFDLALLKSDLDPMQYEEWHFPIWAAKKCEQGLMMEIVDKRLQIFDKEQVHTLIHAAFWCIHENPSMRPYAPIVVRWLEGSSPVTQPSFSSVGYRVENPPR